MQEQVITIASPIFILLIIIEMFIAFRRGKSNFHFSDTINSMSLGMLSQITSAFLKLFLIGIYAWVAHNFALFKLPNAWWVWVAGLLVYDFLYYWLHRSGHEIAVLWAAHVVHHQSERYNLTTALRQTSSGPLLAWIFYLPLAILGVPIEMFIAISLIDLLYQFWVHTELIGKLGWFDRVFVSPSNHRVHHATNDIYLDKNYGGILILWDRLFGTFIEEMDEHKVVYGTRSPLRSWNPVKANIEVYQAIIRDAKRASNWTDKIRIWFKHPGWQPTDVAQQFPHAPFILHRPNFEPVLPTSWKCYCGAQFLLILSITTHFLAVDRTISFANCALYGFWLGAGLLILGGLTERRSNYLWLESIRLILTAGFVLFTGNWFGEFALPALGQGAVLFVTMSSLLSLVVLFKGANLNSNLQQKS
ncbi:sterol desaturase family protein [Solimicrobium silvestre]|uniref:Fatty acid hydroxylase superfamily n=1 Tax=Solimicrobium silvestre TaxID=2099400 RepID=A0A2S9H457_9BURK|nr:sterol desaturase family protein [Solimicrobium silvestre]PRC94764.1 Fatty acid hydroxylase superfamily [Solimicrobium silvestre]